MYENLTLPRSKHTPFPCVFAQNLIEMPQIFEFFELFPEVFALTLPVGIRALDASARPYLQVSR